MRFCPGCKHTEEASEAPVRCPNCEDFMEEYIFEESACTTACDEVEQDHVNEPRKERGMNEFLDTVKEMYKQKEVVDKLKDSLKDQSSIFSENLPQGYPVGSQKSRSG